MIKFLPLIWAEWTRRRARTVLTLLSIVAAFLLFGLLQGVNASFDAVTRQQHLDILFANTKFKTPMPLAYLDKIRQVPGVTAASQAVFTGGYFRDEKNFLLTVATDPASFFSGGFGQTAPKAQVEAEIRTRTGAIVNDVAVKRYGWKVGDVLPVSDLMAKADGSRDWTFNVVGIMHGEDSAVDFPLVLVNYDYIDTARAQNRGTAGRFFVRIRDPGLTTQVATAIDAMFANSAAPTQTVSQKEFMQTVYSQIGDVRQFTYVVMSAVFAMLLLMVFSTMMESVRERTVQIGTLGALGFTWRQLLLLISAECLALCLVAAILGLAISPWLFPLASDYIGTAAFTSLGVQLSVVIMGLGLALLMGLVSAALPAIRAARLDIVDALRRH